MVTQRPGIYCSHWRRVEGLPADRSQLAAFLWSKGDNGILADEMGLGKVRELRRSPRHLM